MFEDLSSAKRIAIDIETKDLHLKEQGSGALRDGLIVGIAIATDDGIREYYSLEHPNSDNCDKEKVFSYLRKELSREHQFKVGANILYDLEYLSVQNVHVKGKIIDVLIAEPLIDENQYQYNLDGLAQKYLGETKKSDVITSIVEANKWKGDPRAHIWKLEAKDVRDYALGDVDLPLRIFEEQRKIIKQEDLEQVLSIELRLLPLLLQMKMGGCLIDMKETDRLLCELVNKKNKLKALIESVGLDASTSHEGRAKMKSFFIKNNLHVPYTEKTKRPSFTTPYLETVDQEEVKWIIEYKHLEKLIGTFLTSQLQNNQINGRIHAQFNSLRDSQGGTVTGRFSSSRPNLQNIPSKKSELSLKCRALFIPEEGELFGSVDYSQIEYRILCHLAMGKGSQEVREAFKNNPHLDIHQWCAEVAGISRTQAKNINFGIIYGQGVGKTATVLGLTIDEAKEFLARFNDKMPFARFTANEAMRRAEHRGWVKTILGRRRRFNKYEPAKYNADGNREEPRSLEEAIAKWGTHIKRAHAYKALNAIVQGSSADLLKLAMVKSYEAGIFNILKPLTTVHDELNVSIPQNKEGEDAYKELVHIMQTCYPFRVPILAEAGIGKNWNEAKNK